MGLFRKRGKPGKSPADVDLQTTISLVLARFAEVGRPVRVDPETSGRGTELIADGGGRFGLHNLFARTSGLDTDELNRAVALYVDWATDVRGRPSDLSDEDFIAMVRVRIVDAGHSSSTYEIPVAGNLACVLCIEYPTTVTFLNDSDLVGRDIDALYSAGLRNVMAQSIDRASEVVPGVMLLAGDSFFTASMVLGMSQLIAEHLPPAPHGVFFGVPNRHAIYVVTPTDFESTRVGLQWLARFVWGMAQRDDNEGGPLSPHIYVWRSGTIELAGLVGDDETLHMLGQGLTLDVMNEISKA